MATVTQELTIDELARETGMTVRNIRAHQSRGLLPPPEVRARTGYYGPEHIARLRIIQDLQGNGYNLAAIKHLLDSGRGSAEDRLGFARVLLAPFEEEQSEVVEFDELVERYGVEGNPKLLARAEKLGLLIPLGEDRYEVPSPKVLQAGEAVVELGVPLEKALDVIEEVARRAEDVSDLFVKLFVDQVWKPFEKAGQPESDWPSVREALERLRPLATEALVGTFQVVMTERVEERFGQVLAQIAGQAADNEEDVA